MPRTLPTTFPTVLLAFPLLVAASCGGDDAAPSPTSGATSSAADFPLYMRGNCHTCHGPDLGGTSLGPVLGDLTSLWNEETLIQYLTDPQGVTDRTPRLREKRGMYMMRMPPAAQAGLSKDEVRQLAQWLLSPDR